jgi:triacylglycerol lipase
MKKLTLRACVLMAAALSTGTALAAGSPSGTANGTANGSGYTQTQYPIVLAHGLFGFDDIFGYSYFYQIPEALQKDGARVYVTEVSAGNGSEVRGEQLLKQVEDIIAITGAKKVNLIGHSQGGQDVRYVAAVRPDLIASVTTVAGVHKGSKVADLLITLAPTGSLQNALSTSVVNGVTELIDLASGDPGLPQNTSAALYDLSTTGSAAFTRKYPAAVPTSACGNGAASVNGIPYYSWSGAGVITTGVDVTDEVLALTALAFGLDANDGLVSKCSSHLGTVIRDNYFQNHLDEVNQVFGVVSPFEASPPSLFRQQANRLKGIGL